MIEQRDSKQLPRFLEFPGDILILEARLKIPRWMVVADDEITRPDQDRTLEDHPRGNGRRSAGSDRRERE